MFEDNPTMESVLRTLGAPDEFNEIVGFDRDRYGFTSSRVGGMWGTAIPVPILEAMEEKGFLSKVPQAWVSPSATYDYRVTLAGRKEAARIYFGFTS